MSQTVNLANRGCLLPRVRLEPAQQVKSTPAGLCSIGVNCLQSRGFVNAAARTLLVKQTIETQNEVAKFTKELFYNPRVDVVDRGHSNVRVAKSYGAVLSCSFFRSGIAGELVRNQMMAKLTRKEIRLVLADGTCVKLGIFCLNTTAWDSDSVELVKEQDRDTICIKRNLKLRQWRLTKELKEVLEPMPWAEKDRDGMLRLLEKILTRECRGVSIALICSLSISRRCSLFSRLDFFSQKQEREGRKRERTKVTAIQQCETSASATSEYNKREREKEGEETSSYYRGKRGKEDESGYNEGGRKGKKRKENKRKRCCSIRTLLPHTVPIPRSCVVIVSVLLLLHDTLPLSLVREGLKPGKFPPLSQSGRASHLLSSSSVGFRFELKQGEGRLVLGGRGPREGGAGVGVLTLSFLKVTCNNN